MSSYFWRNPIQQQIVLGLLRGLHNPNGTVRILDVGCSSGEMTLTYAMLLFDEYGDEWSDRFAITAIDHDEKLIERFQRGLYPENRIYRMPSSYRDRYLRRFTLPAPKGEKAEWTLLKSTALVRQIDIRCEDFNHFECSPGGWDVCVCQNTLLHLPFEAAQSWTETFNTLLRPGGYFICAGNHNEHDRLGACEQLKRLFDPVPHYVGGVYDQWLQRKHSKDPAIQLAEYDPDDPDLAYKIGSIFRKK